MTRLRLLIVSAVVGLVILVVGVAYVSLRTPSYQSTSALVFVPKTRVPNEIANLTGSFASSGTAGTYVEYIASRDTISAANAGNVSVAARAVPDSRVINVVTEGAQGAVQPALRRMLSVIETRQAALNDAWTLNVLQDAQPPSKSGASNKLLGIAVLLLAALGALLTYTALTRLLGAGVGGTMLPPARAVADDEPADEHEDVPLPAQHRW
ncbi:MAG: hypothetical protein JSS99_01000 [Actinobacteria bacterium]|nr:hypothetical protein [Actinomycetota bacterium]